METVMKKEDVSFCEELIREVGAYLFSEFEKGRACLSKEEMTKRFEEVNPKAEKMLLDALHTRFPQYLWSQAEFDLARQEKPEFHAPYWICDAIDGAVHFLQSMPMWATSLCLIEDGRPTVSFVYDPCRDELFTAILGQGAYLNGEKIRTSSKTQLAESILGTLFASSEPMNLQVGKMTADSLSKLMPEAFAIRMQGAVSLHLAYVACGRLDGYWEYGEGVYDWLAGTLLVEEAGGQITDSTGKPFDWKSFGIVAAGSAIHSKLVQFTPAS